MRKALVLPSREETCTPTTSHRHTVAGQVWGEFRVGQREGLIFIVD